jgi:hypothetical protein
MNVVPMFLNCFIPWGVFIWCASCTSFDLMYKRPHWAWFFAIVCYLGCLLLWRVAYWARKEDPAPSWWTYVALMCTAMSIAGTWFGLENFSQYMKPYYSIHDLKVIGQLDVSIELGQNVMDAGVFYFAEGNQVDTSKSWHFKHRDLYCVSPVAMFSGGSPTSPKTNTYDFFAVGKNCCSESSADFRCGSFQNPKARSAIRILDDADMAMYRLAVQQSETLYKIISTHPVFFRWSQDPLEEVNELQGKGHLHYLYSVAITFVICVGASLLATMKFAWIGRSDNVYEDDYQGPGAGPRMAA